MKINIGEKQYDIKYTNRDIFDIEESFDKPIDKILNNENHKSSEIAKIVWHGLRNDFPSFDDFIEVLEPFKYSEYGSIAGQALASAFLAPTKKK